MSRVRHARSFFVLLVAIGLATWGFLDSFVGRVVDVIATLLVVYALFEVFGGKDSENH
jgi:hypothetical protein